MRNGVFSVVLLAVMACGGGGGGKGYALLQQANPNPFRMPGCKVAVDPVTFDKLIYANQPEADRLANMPPDQQARFQDDKKAFSFALKQALVASHENLVIDGPASGGNTFLMRPSLTSYSPGGETTVVVDVTDAAGTQVLEQVSVTAKATTLREASEPLGRSLGRYLKTRFCSR